MKAGFRQLEGDAQRFSTERDPIDILKLDAGKAAHWAVLRWSESAPVGGLGRAQQRVHDLAAWAARGDGGIVVATRDFADVMRWLFGAPLTPVEPMVHPIALPVEPGPERDLALILLASRGRLRLLVDDEITAAELSAMSGYSANLLAKSAAGKMKYQLAGAVTLRRVVRKGVAYSKKFPAPFTGASARELLRVIRVPGPGVD